MNTIISKQHPRFTYKFFSCFIAFTFLISITLTPAMSYAQVQPNTVLNLPVPGEMVNLSGEYKPVIVKGMSFYPQNPLEFDFIVDTGDENLSPEALSEESSKLIKYFLASLTVPEEEMWVNLSPYENDRIIPEDFGYTEMGRDLLAQDYLLKQLTASLIYPEEEIGEEFWDTVYERAYKEYGAVNIPVNTFNKIWIVPKDAVVAEKGNEVYVLNKHLKVMLEEDYVALQHNMGIEEYGLDSIKKENIEELSGVSADVVREVLIPAIEKEINTGKNFAPLRQIYNSMILATWFKKNLKESLLGKIYVDQNKVKGVDVEDKQIKQKIYNQYVEAFKKGVYNYVKEDYDPASQQIIPRKYFSGGAVGLDSRRDYTQIQLDDPAVTVSPVQREMAERVNRELVIAERDNGLQKVHFGLLENANDEAMATQGTAQIPQLSTRIIAESKIREDLNRPEGARQFSHLVHIDVNMLKWNNDVFGKKGTDAAFNKLKEYLGELAKNLGPGSIAWQHGGDEFAIAIANNSGGYKEQLQQFKDALEKKVFVVGALSGIDGVDNDLLDIAITKNGGQISRVGGEVLFVLDKSSEDTTNREYLQQFLSFVNSNENLNLSLKNDTWVDSPVINNQLNLGLSVGVVEINKEIPDAATADAQTLYEEALHVAEKRKDLSKKKVRDTSTFGKTDIVYTSDIDIARPREETPGRSIAINNGVDYVKSFQALQIQASKSLVSPSWAKDVYYGDSLDKARSFIEGIERQSPERLDNAIIFQLGMSGYNDPNGWISAFEEQFKKAGIPDERIDTRDLKVLNDTEQLGYKAGDEAIGLLRYGTITQVPFNNNFDVIIVRGPPAGPIGLLIPKDANYEISDADITADLDSMAKNIRTFFNKNSFVKASNLTVAWDRVQGRAESRSQDFWARLGTSLNEVNTTRYVVEARDASLRKNEDVDKYDPQIVSQWEATERRRSEIAVEARAKLKEKAKKQGVDLAPVYRDDNALTSAFSKKVTDQMLNLYPQLKQRTDQELEMSPVTVPHRGSLDMIINSLAQKGVLEEGLDTYARDWKEIHDTAYRNAKIDFNDKAFETTVKDTWKTIGEAVGLDVTTPAFQTTMNDTYELLRNNSDSDTDPVGNLFLVKILGHGSLGMAINTQELMNQGIAPKEAKATAMLAAAHHPGFPINFVEDTVLPGIGRELPGADKTAVLPILLIDMERDFRTFVMADYVNAQLKGTEVTDIVQLRQQYERGKSQQVIEAVTKTLRISKADLADLFTINGHRDTLTKIAGRTGLSQEQVAQELKRRRQASANYLRMKIADYVADKLGVMDRAHARMHALLGYGLDRITSANPGTFKINPLTGAVESVGGEIIDKKYGLVASSNITDYKQMTLQQVYSRSIANVQEELDSFVNAVEDMKVGLDAKGVALLDELKTGLVTEGNQLIDSVSVNQKQAFDFINKYLRGSKTIAFSGHLRDIETDTAIVESLINSPSFNTDFSMLERSAASYLLRSLKALNTDQVKKRVNALRSDVGDLNLSNELPAATQLSPQEVISQWTLIGGEEVEIQAALDTLGTEADLKVLLQGLRKKALGNESNVVLDKADHLLRVAEYSIEQAERDGKNRRAILKEVEDYAATTKKAQRNVGGINLNANLLDLQIKRDDAGVPLPAFDQPINDMKIDGFLPVIIDIVPIQNIPLFISFNDQESNSGV